MLCMMLRYFTVSARLVGGTVNRGRLEVFKHGVWGTVCDYLFGESDAKVACFTAGFGYVLRSRFLSPPSFFLPVMLYLFCYFLYIVAFTQYV